MRTPRDVLLEKHRQAETDLNRIRKQIVRDLDRRNRALPFVVFAKLWGELIRPCRFAWTGMAALWLLMWVMNAHVSEGRLPGSTIVTNTGSTPTPTTFEALKEQRQLLTELLPPADLAPAEPPRRGETRPHSERRHDWKMI